MSSPFKAMILSKVAVGRGYRSLVDMPNLQAPPQGYDSVRLTLFLPCGHNLADVNLGWSCWSTLR